MSAPICLANMVSLSDPAHRLRMVIILLHHLMMAVAIPKAIPHRRLPNLHLVIISRVNILLLILLLQLVVMLLARDLVLVAIIVNTVTTVAVALAINVATLIGGLPKTGAMVVLGVVLKPGAHMVGDLVDLVPVVLVTLTFPTSLPMVLLRRIIAVITTDRLLRPHLTQKMTITPRPLLAAATQKKLISPC